MDSKKSVAGKSSSKSIQKIEKVELEEYNHEKIIFLGNFVSSGGLQEIRDLGHKGLDVWSEFLWFAYEDMITFLLNCIEDGHICCTSLI